MLADFEQVGFGEWAPAPGLDVDQESVPEYRSMIYERRRHQIQYRRARLGGRTVLGRGFLIVSAANLLWPGYARLFLDLAGSIYPGYRPGGGPGSVIVGTLNGLVDGAAAGAVIGWMYNTLAASMKRRS